MAVRLPPHRQSPLATLSLCITPERSKLNNSARAGSTLDDDSRGAGRRTVAFHSPPECFAPRCLLQAVAVTIMTKESGPQPPQSGSVADTDQAAGARSQLVDGVQLGASNRYDVALNMWYGRKSQEAEALDK